MVNVLKVKSGGAWVTVPDGTVKVNKNDTWVSPAYIYVKDGGVWVDSGYRGFPAAPVNFAVNAWDYDSVSVKWGAGSGGATISTYEIELRNSGGVTVVSEKTDTSSPSTDFVVANSTKYQLFIRAKSTAGLYSAWVGPIKISIGKPASTYYTTETGTRPWSSAKAVVGYKDAAVGPTVPTNVVVQSLRYQITNDFSGILSPYGSHSISRWANGAEKEQFNWPVQTIDTTVNVTDYTSNGGVQGMICRGTGWSTSATGSFTADGTITATGTETYTYQQAHTNPAVANSYW